MKHTQGKVQQNGQNGIHMGPTCIALTYGNDPNRKDNAEHIAALWNAADGMTTEEAVKYIEHGREMERFISDVTCGDYTHDRACDLREKLEG
jgi:hypothetical protein